MKKMLFSFVMFTIAINSFAANTTLNSVDKETMRKYVQCAYSNDSCGGELPTQVGVMNVDPKLYSMNIRLNDLCGLRINYFIAHIWGESKIKMPEPDSSIRNFGNYDLTVLNDYRYTIFSLNKGKDATKCHAVGSWYPDDGSTRQENIDRAYRLIGKSEYF